MKSPRITRSPVGVGVGISPSLIMGGGGGGPSTAIKVRPLVGQLLFTGPAPTVGLDQIAKPLTGSLSFIGPAPTISLDAAPSPGVGALVFTGPLPVVDNVDPSSGADLSLNFLTATIGSDGAPVAD